MRKALKGLERCARKAVLAATRRAKKLLATTTSDGAPQSPSTKALPAAGNTTTLSSTAFGKKFSQSALDSTAFPTVASDDMAGTSSGKETHVHRHHRAVGMVFGLALVQRLFQRYAADNEDKTQLLVSYPCSDTVISDSSNTDCLSCAAAVSAEQIESRRSTGNGDIPRQPTRLSGVAHRHRLGVGQGQRCTIYCIIYRYLHLVLRLVCCDNVYDSSTRCARSSTPIATDSSLRPVSRKRSSNWRRWRTGCRLLKPCSTSCS